MTINPEKTIFNVGDIVYDNNGKYVVMNYHMPDIERGGKHYIENNGMLNCMSLSSGEVFEKLETRLTGQSIYDIYQVGNLVKVFIVDKVPFGDIGTIIHKDNDSYTIKINSTGGEITLKMFNETTHNFFVPRWIDQMTLAALGFEPEADRKIWTDGVVELISAKPVVITSNSQEEYFEAIRNYGFKVRIVKEDMFLLIPPFGDLIRAVHELQNIYASTNVRKSLDLSGLLD